MTKIKPKRGDRFWTILRRVSRSDDIIADSPYKRPVRISRESVESRTPIEIPHRPIDSASLINPNIEQAAFVEIISVKSRAIAEAINMDEWPTECPIDLQNNVGEINPNYNENEALFDNYREERVDWRGTKQTITDKDIKSRGEVFSEKDIRGSKNDLI